MGLARDKWCSRKLLVVLRLGIGERSQVGLRAITGIPILQPEPVPLICHSTIAIVHPRNRRHPKWLELLRILKSEGVEPDIHFSEWAGHSSVLAQELCPGEGTVLSVGGDGTFSEVLNGWMRQAHRGSPRFVLVSLGTGNDFARDQKLRSDPQEWASAVLRPQTKMIDLGRVRFQTPQGPGERYFVVGTTVGFSAEVTRFFQRMPRLLPGTSQYLFSLMVSLLRWRNRSVEFELDQRVSQSQDFFNLNIANVRFYGGGMYSSPRAVVDSGELETVLMELSKFGVIKALPQNYNGRFEGVPGVFMRAGKSLRVTSEYDLPVQADGEYLGTTPIEVEILPRLVSFALPTT